MKAMVFAALLSCAAVTLPAPAAAGETRVYIGAEAAGGRQSDVLFHLTGVDARAPIFAIRHQNGDIAVAIDDVPVDTANLGNGGQLSFGYAQANVQLWNHQHRFAVAAGQTLYYLQDARTLGGQTQTFATRSAGAAFGVLAALPTIGRTTLTASVFTAPSMHERTTERISNGLGGAPKFSQGSLTDVLLLAEARRSEHMLFAYGLRYVNYAAGDATGAAFSVDPGRARTAAFGAFAALGLRIR